MENQDDWNPEEFDLENADVLPKKIISNVKSDIKENNAIISEINKDIKQLEKRLKAYNKVLTKKKSTQEEKEDAEKYILLLTKEMGDKDNEKIPYQNIVNELNTKIKTHTDLEEELKESQE
jgi:septal ring factor EnvC (AmiA/AmiB activator)